MKRRDVLLTGTAAAMALAMPSRKALASAEPFKIGLILPMTGPFASTGRQIESAVRLYIVQNGDEVAGRKIKVILKDDASIADATKRHAQELIVHERVHALAGFGLTPLAFAVAPLSSQAKMPTVVMAAATSSITKASPYIVRTSYTTPQVASKAAEWAFGDGIRRVATLVSDYGPGIDAEASFAKGFTTAGGEMLESPHVPLANPDFAPFLQRVADQHPDAIFVFVPSGAGALFMKQFVERGLDKSGIKLLADGSLTDDDILDSMGDPALVAITSFHYSAARDTPVNRAFTKAFAVANKGGRPNFMAVGGYDGMHALYAGLKATGGNPDGTALVEAIKGLSWESPRGPIRIDPETRDIVQNIYMRRVERVDGQLWNIEFKTFEAVNDPGKSGAS